MSSGLLAVGKITGAFGVRGWVKVWSYTDPIENLFDYAPWQVKIGGEFKTLAVIDGKVHGRGLVAELEGVSDRNAAELLNQAEIFINRDALDDGDDDGYYWADLEGCQVVNEAGVELGTLHHLFDNSASQVMVIKDANGERMIPWVIDEIVKSVDMQTRRIVVAWQADW